MDKKELIKYWEETSDKDYNTMKHLFNTGDFHWSLFIGHIVIEKLLKALYVQLVNNNVPRTHDLLRIAEAAGLELTEEMKNTMDFITTFNISTRYPDYKQEFYKKCTQSFAEENIRKIEGVKEWLKQQLKT